jgi:hypothetical protein
MAGNTLNSHVGPAFSATGSSPGYDQTFEEHNAERVVQTRGKYGDATKRGFVYSGCTAATGVAPGTALGTTVPYALYNPSGSGKRLVVQKITMGLISGTLGAGVIWITGSAAGDAIPTGTTITPRNRDIGAPNASIATCLTTATITTNAAKMIGILCSLTEQVVATTALNNEVIAQDIDGEICIESLFAMHLCGTTAAGSSPLVVFCTTWEEESLSN